MTFTVMSYNIKEGGEGRLPLIVDIIKEQHPDAVALLEANSHPAVERLARDVEMRVAYGDANSAFAVAWLSRMPIERAQNHRFAALAKTLLEIEVAWAGDTVHLFATHLAARGDVRQPADEVPVILDALRPLTDQPHLLAGDFNALRPGDPVGAPPQGVEKWGDARPGAPRQAIQLIMDAGYTDCYRMLHPQEPGYTYPSGAPWLRLDYIFATPRMAARLHTCEIVTGGHAPRASDHLPLRAEFRS